MSRIKFILEMSKEKAIKVMKIIFQKTVKQFQELSSSWKKRHTVFCFSLLFGYGLLGQHVYFVKALTDSLDHHWFVLKKTTSLDSIQRGDYIHFKKPQLKCWVIKKVVGRAGDSIYINDGVMTVNGEKLYLCNCDSKGKQLNPLKSKIIPKGYFFVHGTHEKSFDSRYEDFGLVSYSDIKGVGKALI